MIKGQKGNFEFKIWKEQAPPSAPDYRAFDLGGEKWWYVYVVKDVRTGVEMSPYDFGYYYRPTAFQAALDFIEKLEYGNATICAITPEDEDEEE